MCVHSHVHVCVCVCVCDVTDVVCCVSSPVNFLINEIKATQTKTLKITKLNNLLSLFWSIIVAHQLDVIRVVL